MCQTSSSWKRFSRPLRLLVLIAVLALVAWVFFSSIKTGDSGAVQGPGKSHVIDEAGVLPSYSITKFDQYLDWIFTESDIDIRFLFVSAIKGKTIEEYAVEKVEELRVGGLGKEARGLLLLYDVQAKRLRIEVGYGLEGYFTDAFLSYLTHEHTQAFFASGDRTTGLRLLIRMLHHRIREAVLGNDFDPRVIEFIRNRGHLSGGGGVTAVMPGMEGNKAGFRGDLSGTQKAAYTPQPTPGDVYELYLAWMAGGEFDPRISIFTEESQARLATLPITPAYFHYILMTEYGKTSRIDIRGNLALQYFTDSPLTTPHFYRKTEKGWQMDMVAEIRNSRNRVGGVYSWDYRGKNDIYTKAFEDKLVSIKKYIRIKGGDNRELPIRN